MRRIRRLPAHDATNGWANILPPRAPNPPLKGDVSADWLVIGAGFAGLAAARRLAENRPGETVALVEAAGAGDGASSRNSGFVIDLPHNVGGDGDNIAAAHRALRLARAATGWLDEIVTGCQIDCQWSRRGQYMAAASAEGEAALDGFTAELASIDEPFTEVGAADSAARLGTTRYRRMVHTPGTVLMQPAALVRGLAGALPPNVTLYENTPVTAIDYGPPVRAETPGGTIRAKGVILAVNGFAPEFGAYQGRVFPITLFASITRPLTETEQAGMGKETDWGLVPALAFGGPTIRYTQDRRLTMRSMFAYRSGMAARSGDYRRARALQADQIRARWPHLSDDMIEHTWAGVITMSWNFAPGFGQMAPNVWTAVCQNGVGVTKGTIAGRLAADMATGRDDPLMADMEALGKPVRLPPKPFLEVGVPLWIKRLERQARAER